MNERFRHERERLGLRTGAAAADALGVAPSTISKIEKGVLAPSTEVLVRLGQLGGDVHFVLLGTRRGAGIDTTVFGMCEAALASAYAEVRPGAGRRSAKPRHIAALYNDAMRAPPGADMAAAVRAAAARLIALIDDPSNPSELERVLFSLPEEPAAPLGVSISGDGNRAAGRDYQEGEPGKRRGGRR